VVLLLELIKIIPIPPIPNVIFWPLYAAAAATVLVLAHGTDIRSLGSWSPSTQQCIELADQEALRYHHDFVGTEHVLLGLLEPENSAVSKVLGNMGVSREAVRAEIEKIVVPQPQAQTGRALVGTPRAKRAFVLGLQEAKSLRCERMEPPHLFLGLLREGSGVAALVLKKLGVDLERARAEILKKSR
jgi:ATP-dependent Clp protease ATP-binding subunit ClpC